MYPDEFSNIAVVDLTHTLREGMPGLPDHPPFRRRGQPGEVGVLHLPEHAGTHLDAPVEYDPAGATVDRFPPDLLVVPLVVIDVREAVAEDPEYGIDIPAIDAFERHHGVIPLSAVVVADTGWAERWPASDRYLNRGEDGRLHLPYWQPAAAVHLIQGRGVTGLGIDGLSLDGGNGAAPVHQELARANRYGLENLCNLHQLPPVGAWLVVGAIPIQGGTGAPARILGLVPRAK